MFKILMVTLSILKALNGGIWTMQPEAAKAFEPMVNKIINGESFDFKRSASTSTEVTEQLNNEMKAVYVTSNVIEPRWTSIDRAVPGSIAVIPLQGVVMQEDNCGDPGLKTLRAWMQKADANANIIGQILYVDSPGGSAQGVATLSKFIKDLNKPIVSYVDALACSGGYWIASATREIICAENLATLGSIGAFSTFYDSTKNKEQRGYREIQVYAPQSTKKNKIFSNMISGDADISKPAQQEYADRFLKPLVADFHAAVKLNRRAQAHKFTDDVFAGDIFTAKEAIQVGLADSIGDFNYAIKRVQQLSKKSA